MSEKIPLKLRALAQAELKRRQAERDELSRQFAAIRKRNVIPAFEFLYDTHMPDGKIVRFKVAKGGRGKGASWAIADRLIEKAASEKSFILCTREVQNSLADSVYRLLKERISTLGYSRYFYITNSVIRSLTNGSEFIFKGLNDLSVDQVKSMEGVSDVWLAEAHNVGARSWMVLEPTIRTEGSTIYVDYNPDEENSPTNIKFTRECPDDALVRHLTFVDNPHFPSVLENLRQQALARIANAPNEEAREQATLDYNHVWLGHTRKVSKASIFGAYHVVEAFTPNDGADKWDGPYDGADWGFGSDPTVRIRCWIRTIAGTSRKHLCIEREAYLLGSDGMSLQLNALPKAFDEFPNSRTTMIRADCAQPQTIGYMKNQGFRIEGAKKWSGSVEDGVEHIRGAYDLIVIHPRCVYTAKEAILYSYKVDKLTGDVKPDILDANNHCWDAVRYALAPLIERKKGSHLFG
jgi:phage terminase large subunit